MVALCLTWNVQAGVISVVDQHDFDLLQSKIEKCIKAGDKDIVVTFGCGPFYYKDDHVLLHKVASEDITLHFKGNRTKIISSGKQ